MVASILNLPLNPGRTSCRYEIAGNWIEMIREENKRQHLPPLIFPTIRNAGMRSCAGEIHGIN
jgi:hypothetical protein